MANQINTAGKFFGGLLLILFTLVPATLLTGLWPNRLPEVSECPLYSLRLFHVRLQDSLCRTAPHLGDTLRASSADTVTPGADTAQPLSEADTNHALPEGTEEVQSAAADMVDLNTLILMLVAIAGFMGSMIHIAGSFTRYVGADNYKNTWLLWYVIKPFSAAALAMAGYFLFRGGLLNYGDAAAINLYGVISLAILTGLFTDTATRKLKEVFDTIFGSPALPDPLPAAAPVQQAQDAQGPAVSGISTSELSRQAENEIVLYGAGLNEAGLKAAINGEPVVIADTAPDKLLIRYRVPDAQAAATGFILVLTLHEKEIYRAVLNAVVGE